MSLSWSEIKETILQDYNIGYSRQSIQAAINTIAETWGTEYLENFPKNAVWHIAQLVDLGLIIRKLIRLEGSDELLDRMIRNEWAAYSEARLAAFFSKQGFEVKLQPYSLQSHRLNDIALRIGDEWINIEVKTPVTSELERELSHEMNELLKLAESIPISREVRIWLTRIPSEDERRIIMTKTHALAVREIQPAGQVIDNIAWIYSDHLKIEIKKSDDKGSLKAAVRFVQPKNLDVYDNSIVLTFMKARFGGSLNDNVQVYVDVPFEDLRLVEFLKKKSRQLSRDTINIVAIDTSSIPLSSKHPNRQRWREGFVEIFGKTVSKRIGAVLLFNGWTKDGKYKLESSILTNPNAYRKIPQSFTEKCDLNRYDVLIEDL